MVDICRCLFACFANSFAGAGDLLLAFDACVDVRMADHENKTILLRQLEAERDRLQAEARALDQSMSTRDASLE